MRIDSVDVPTGDNSKQYNMISNNGGVVQFAILDNEMCAHTWQCVGEGRYFLKELEAHAQKLNLELTVPSVINIKLAYILKENGYVPNNIEWIPEPGICEIVELWKKVNE